MLGELVLRAPSPIVVVHSHPRRLAQVGKALSVRVLDSMVFARDTFVSSRLFWFVANASGLVGAEALRELGSEPPRYAACMFRFLVLSSLAAGCTYPLRVAIDPVENNLTDRTAKSPTNAGPPAKSVIILPPSGSSRGAFEGYLNEFERALLQKGLRVVSSAVTGRVVQERKSESAAQLSDVERALILARETGADALLQVGSLETVNATKSRWFCTPSRERELEECTAKQYLSSEFGRSISGPQWRFQGRLIDVRSGEVLASIEFTTAVVDHLVANLRDEGNQDPKLEAECRPCSRESYWCVRCEAARQAAIEALIGAAAATASTQPTSAWPAQKQGSATDL